MSKYFNPIAIILAIIAALVMMASMCYAAPELTYTIVDNEDGSTTTTLVGNAETMAMLVTSFNPIEETTETQSVTQMAVVNMVDIIIVQLANTAGNIYEGTQIQELETEVEAYRDEYLATLRNGVQPGE